MKVSIGAPDSTPVRKSPSGPAMAGPPADVSLPRSSRRACTSRSAGSGRCRTSRSADRSTSSRSGTCRRGSSCGTTHLLDLAQHRAPVREDVLVRDARRLDRAERDLDGAVGRRPERLELRVRVVPLPAVDRAPSTSATPLMSGAKLDTYEPASLKLRRRVRAVAAEHLRPLALLEQLLTERLRVGRLLRREEDDVRVARRPASRATRSRSSAPRSTAGSPRRSAPAGRSGPRRPDRPSTAPGSR